MSIRRRTKIIATVGPAISNYEKIAELIETGVDVFRLNFSHGSHEEHKKSLDLIRQVSRDLNKYVGVLQDLSGPKIRITQIEENLPPLVKGDLIEIKNDAKLISSNKILYTGSIDPSKFLKSGDSVLLADGIMELTTKQVNPDSCLCEVKKGGVLRSKIGLAFPNSKINLPATTEKDLVDFEWGLENNIDFFAVSFVQTAEDVINLRNIAKKKNIDPFIIAKIEMNTALQNIDEILNVSDSLMVARGDLGVELPVEKLPAIQRDLISRSNAIGKPVIVATQMLHSMVNSNRPTRAEVTDIATAVRSGADCVMLSEETAIGAFPQESVEYLAKIAHEAEKDFDFEVFKLRFKDNPTEFSIPNAIAYAACAAAHNLNATAIIACTETGFSARLIAKFRPKQALFGISRNISSLRRMCLFWGVKPVMAEIREDDTEVSAALRLVKNLENHSADEIAVTTGGLKMHAPGSSSVVDIRAFGSLE